MGRMSDFVHHVGEYMTHFLLIGVLGGIMAGVVAYVLPDVIGWFLLEHVLPSSAYDYFFQSTCVPNEGGESGWICHTRMIYIAPLFHVVCSMFLTLGLWVAGRARPLTALAIYWSIIFSILIVIGVTFIVPLYTVNVLIDGGRLPMLVADFFNAETCTGDGVEYWRVCVKVYMWLAIPAFHLCVALLLSLVRVTMRRQSVYVGSSPSTRVVAGCIILLVVASLAIGSSALNVADSAWCQQQIRPPPVFDPCNITRMADDAEFMMNALHGRGPLGQSSDMRWLLECQQGGMQWRGTCLGWLWQGGCVVPPEATQELLSIYIVDPEGSVSPVNAFRREVRTRLNDRDWRDDRYAVSAVSSDQGCSITLTLRWDNS
jgi:hypothetical protein